MWEGRRLLEAVGGPALLEHVKVVRADGDVVRVVVGALHEGLVLQGADLGASVLLLGLLLDLLGLVIMVSPTHNGVADHVAKGNSSGGRGHVGEEAGTLLDDSRGGSSGGSHGGGGGGPGGRGRGGGVPARLLRGSTRSSGS